MPDVMSPTRSATATVIKTRRQHKAALKRIDELMDAEAGTREADELKLLAHLVETYERKHFVIIRPSA